jgi:hypothetical protein
MMEPNPRVLLGESRMLNTQERENAFSFPTENEQSQGMLTLGRRKYPVVVARYSWAGYTIEVTEKLAKLLQQGRIGRLNHQGSTYAIKCASRERLEKNRVQVELERQDDEADRRRFMRRTKTKSSPTISLNQRDPILTLSTIAFVVLMLLIAPGWGERWGTSQYFTTGISSVFTGICDAARSIFG